MPLRASSGDSDSQPETYKVPALPIELYQRDLGVGE